MKTITVISGSYNEAGNIEEMVRRVFAVASGLPQYHWEYLVIDNCSTDGTRLLLRDLARNEPRLKIIFNVRNFGHIRSPYYGMMQAQGDAVIYLASDLQDPPEMLPEFIKHWEGGAKVVAAIKRSSEESVAFYMARRAFYELIARLAEIDLLRNFTGFGLYDKAVMDHLRKWEDPYPYHRGMISELGYPVTQVLFDQPSRKRGLSKNNIYTLFDIAMLAFTNHTKVPLRLATIVGFGMAMICFLFGLFYLVLKLIFWKSFAVGIAPLVVGLFFIGSVQMLFIGVLGEYIGAIHTKISKRPMVVEQERINF